MRIVSNFCRRTGYDFLGCEGSITAIRLAVVLVHGLKDPYRDWFCLRNSNCRIGIASMIEKMKFGSTT